MTPLTMPDSQDYRNLLDEKFNGIHSAIDLQFANVNEKLNNISVQTTRTNGRVTNLEGQVKSLEFNEGKHMAGYCPQADTFKEIKKDIQALKDDKNSDVEIMFIKKYPKVSFAIVVATCLVIIFSYTGFMSMREANAIGTQNVHLNEQIIHNQDMLKKLETQMNELNKNNPAK